MAETTLRKDIVAQGTYIPQGLPVKMIHRLKLGYAAASSSTNPRVYEAVVQALFMTASPVELLYILQAKSADSFNRAATVVGCLENKAGREMRADVMQNLTEEVLRQRGWIMKVYMRNKVIDSRLELLDREQAMEE